MLKVPERLLLGLVALSFVTIALFLATDGYEALLWDDSEYVLHAVQTADALHARSLFAWPRIIYAEQHYGKPPLYVESLAAAILVVGRRHVPLAAGIVGMLSSLLLAVGVYAIVRRFASANRSVLAVLAVCGLAVVGRFAPTAFPDVQLAACAVWTVTLLIYEGSWKWLGAVLGLGVLSKTTFPVTVALPILYAWWTSADRIRFTRRLIASCILGGLIGGLWYAANWREAMAYVSFAYSYDTAHSVGQQLAAWTELLASEGIGWILLAGLAAPLGSLVFGRCTPRPAFPVRPVVLLLLGAIPLLAILMTATEGPNTRHPLPALVLLALAALLAAFWAADASRYGRVAMACLAVTTVTQWAIAKAAEVPSVASALRETAAGGRLRRLVPALDMLQPVALDDVRWIVGYASNLGSLVPRDWYLAGNEGSVSVERLQLAGYLERLPVHFEYAGYFIWTRERTEAQIEEMARRSSMLIVVEQIAESDSSNVLYRNTPMVWAALGRFHPLGGSGRVNLFASQQVYDSIRAVLPPTAPPPQSTKGTIHFDGIDVSECALNSCTLKVSARRTHALPCSLKLFVHAFDWGGRMSVWDQPLNPAACRWDEGQTQQLSFELPANCRTDRSHMEMGFFDEADRAHGWPPVRKLDGGRNIPIFP